MTLSTKPIWNNCHGLTDDVPFKKGKKWEEIFDTHSQTVQHPMQLKFISISMFLLYEHMNYVIFIFSNGCEGEKKKKTERFMTDVIVSLKLTN